MSSKKHSLVAKRFNKILVIMIGVLFAFTILLGVSLVFFLDKMSKETSKNKHISLNNNKKIETLIDVQNEMKNVKRLEEKVNKYIPEDKEISGLLKDLEGISNTNGLSFTAFTTAAGQAKAATKETSTVEDSQLNKVDNYYAIPFQIELGGSFVKINDMIMAIESYGRLLQIESISYKQPKETTDQTGDNTIATLKINAFKK